MGRSTRTRMLHCDYWAGITALPDWEEHHAAALRTHRCNQPDLQTIHLNAAQQQDATPPPPPTHTASRALLLQTTNIPTETARLVRCHNPWPSEDVYFRPEDALPACDRSSRTFKRLRDMDSHP